MLFFLQSKRIVLVRTRKQLSQLMSECCKSVVVCKLAFVSANEHQSAKMQGCGRGGKESSVPASYGLRAM